MGCTLIMWNLQTMVLQEISDWDTVGQWVVNSYERERGLTIKTVGKRDESVG